MALSLGASSEARRRRKEVEEVLAAAGLLRGPRRLATVDAPPEDRRVHGERLAVALGSLGPWFAAFGRYLGSRADLFSDAACEALAATPCDLVPLDRDAVDRVLRDDLGGGAGDLFQRFEPRPHEVGLHHQVHTAQLLDGTPALVAVFHSLQAAAGDGDLHALDVVGRALPPPAADMGRLRTAFDRHLAACSDARAQARALAEMAADGGDPDVLVLPRIDDARTAARVLTLERCPGEDPATWQGSPSAAARLARRLCLAFLEQALNGRHFAVGGRVRVLADGRLALLGGEISDLSHGTRHQLAAYIAAVAVGDTDLAFDHLRRALDPPEGLHRDLRRRMRQSVPVRGGVGEAELADRLLLHWRLLRECGVAVSPEVVDVYRALLCTVRRARRIDPGGDALRDALEEHRWRRAWKDLSRVTEPRRMASMLGDYFESASLLPQRLERLLVELDDRRPPGPPAADDPPPASAAAPVAALLATMAAVALVGLRLAPVAAWAEPVSGAVFLLLGALLLRRTLSSPRRPQSRKEPR